MIPIEEVDDDTFAQKVLGDGIAIIPENGNIYAPFDAEVVMVMDTGHAIGLMDKINNEFLIHIGINTPSAYAAISFFCVSAIFLSVT